MGDQNKIRELEQRIERLESLLAGNLDPDRGSSLRVPLHDPDSNSARGTGCLHDMCMAVPVGVGIGGKLVLKIDADEGVEAASPTDPGATRAKIDLRLGKSGKWISAYDYYDLALDL